MEPYVIYGNIYVIKTISGLVGKLTKHLAVMRKHTIFTEYKIRLVNVVEVFIFFLNSVNGENYKYEKT